MKEDIYTELLDIPPGPRPPNHYQLLSLPLFESDAKKIHKAVLKQTARVRKWALAPDPERARRVQSMLNEVNGAGAVLENPETKPDYDRGLADALGVPLPEIQEVYELEEVEPIKRPSAQAPTHACDWCGAPMGPSDVICLACGYDTREEGVREIDLKAFRKRTRKKARSRLPSGRKIAAAAAIVLGIGALVLAGLAINPKRKPAPAPSTKPRTAPAWPAQGPRPGPAKAKPKAAPSAPVAMAPSQTTSPPKPPVAEPPKPPRPAGSAPARKTPKKKRAPTAMRGAPEPAPPVPARRAAPPKPAPAKTVPLPEFAELPLHEGWTAAPRRVTVATSSGECEREIPYCKNSVGMEFVAVPAGEFLMGSIPDEAARYADEGPQRTAQISRPFYISACEVTQSQYEQVMQANPSDFKGPRNPVETVSWHDAMTFCKRLSEKEGIRYRLPTEAEWEYACRAAMETPFCCGDGMSAQQANYGGGFRSRSGEPLPFRRKPAAVGSFAPNAFGLYDMHGNVSEWCLDLYGEYGSGDPAARTDPGASGPRVLRGGSWVFSVSHLRSASRGAGHPSEGHNDFGFRVVVEVPEIP